MQDNENSHLISYYNRNQHRRATRISEREKSHCWTTCCPHNGGTLRAIPHR